MTMNCMYVTFQHQNCWLGGLMCVYLPQANYLFFLLDERHWHKNKWNRNFTQKSRNIDNENGYGNDKKSVSHEVSQPKNRRIRSFFFVYDWLCQIHSIVTISMDPPSYVVCVCLCVVYTDKFCLVFDFMFTSQCFAHGHVLVHAWLNRQW